MNPIAYAKAAVIGLAFAVLSAAGGAWLGWSKRGEQLEVEKAKLIVEHGKKLVLLNERVIELDAEREKEAQNAEVANDLYHDALRAGRVRVFVPVRPADPVDPATPGIPAETRAELDPEVAVRLDRIANDGDAAILDLNLCIDRYNEVRNRLNASN